MSTTKQTTPLEVYKTGKSIRSPGKRYALIKATRQGVKRADLVDFAKAIKHSLSQIAEIIPASYSTLSKKDIFDKEISERIFELAEVFSLGHNVFGNDEKFNRWIHKKNLALGGMIPFSLLDTSRGVQMVLNELQRIDYGIFA